MGFNTVLAIDTAMAGCSVAVYAEGTVRASENKPMDRGQAEALVPMVEDVLERSGAAYEDLEAIVTTIGPGAFTGLRVGLSTARSLGLALEIPVLGITTLKALALKYFSENTAENQLVVLIETKRDDFYAQIFDESGAAISEPFVASAQDVLQKLQGQSILIGDALARFESEIGEQDECVFTSGYEFSDMGMMAEILAQKGGDESVFNPPEPLYLRDADVSQSKKRQRRLA